MLKKYLTYKIPVWAMAIGIVFCYFGILYTQPKPPMSMIPIQIAGTEKLFLKTTSLESLPMPEDTKKEYLEFSMFLKKYLYISLSEYKSMYIIIYGELPASVNQLFDDTMGKVQDGNKR